MKFIIGKPINILIISVEVDFSSHYGNTATHTFIVTQTEFDKLESALKRDPLHLDCMIITWYRVIAQVKNKSQLEMFTHLETSRTILEDLIDEYGLNQSNSFEDPEFISEIKEPIHKELLEEAMWDPKSVLGKLEFDRRAVEDDIQFSLEICITCSDIGDLCVDGKYRCSDCQKIACGYEICDECKVVLDDDDETCMDGNSTICLSCYESMEN
tara:strand:- start:31 stop:669 length:639 start_codon:yes stop_codon:yes gene_type:complete